MRLMGNERVYYYYYYYYANALVENIKRGSGPQCDKNWPIHVTRQNR